MQGQIKLICKSPYRSKCLRLRRSIFNKISFCEAKAFLLKNLIKVNLGGQIPLHSGENSIHASPPCPCGKRTVTTAHQSCPPIFLIHRSKVLIDLLQKVTGAGRRPAKLWTCTAHQSCPPMSRPHRCKVSLPLLSARGLPISQAVRRGALQGIGRTPYTTPARRTYFITSLAEWGLAAQTFLNHA